MVCGLCDVWLVWCVAFVVCGLCGVWLLWCVACGGYGLWGVWLVGGVACVVCGLDFVVAWYVKLHSFESSLVFIGHTNHSITMGSRVARAECILLFTTF